MLSKNSQFIDFYKAKPKCLFLDIISPPGIISMVPPQTRVLGSPDMNLNKVMFLPFGSNKMPKSLVRDQFSRQPR